MTDEESLLDSSKPISESSTPMGEIFVQAGEEQQ